MPHPYYPAGNPKFNHVALSVPSDLLDETNRADLCGYFDEVLGFEEMPTETIDRKRLILSCVHWDQFIFLVAAYVPGRIKVRLKHPFLVAIKTWAFAHLIANGDLASIILFGSFLAYAVFARITLKRAPRPDSSRFRKPGPGATT